jgi:hypothetical protein
MAETQAPADPVAAELPEITRPNGKPYRPRKLVAYAVNDADLEVGGAVVFGTHDPAKAHPLADVLITLHVLAASLGLDLEAAWKAKAAVIAGRPWRENGDG